MQSDRTWLTENWRDAFCQVIGGMTGERPTARGIEERPPESGLMWWEQALSVDEGARLWTGASAAAWQEAGRCVLSSAGLEESDPQTLKSTYLELLSQTGSGVAQRASQLLRREVSCTAGCEAPPPADASAEVIHFQLGSSSIQLSVCFSAELAASLASGETIAPKGARSPAPPPAERVASAQPMDLLLDVELPVSISFGRAQLALKDLIKMTSGSIVELNRSVSEPVEVIVNNCVIARGEVVVVEGNFGVRIQEVVSRQERLRTLK